MTDASAFPRRILLCTVGLAPQIVTETLYALCVRKSPSPFVPTEIHVITTADGEKRTRTMLLDPPHAQLAKFAEEFGLPVAETLRPDRIHVVRDAKGEPLRDISTEPHNQAAADLIIETVYNLTKDEEAALHFSIAGGRKTMGFLLGTAASLFARPQDKLSHVLVEQQAFEQHPEFFFKPKIPRTLYDKHKQPIGNTADANIVLAEIPFVKLRQGLPTPLLEGVWSFSQTVVHAQKAVAGHELVLDHSSQYVSCQGIVFELTPMQFALYSILAKRRLEAVGGDGFVHWTGISGPEFLAEFSSLPNATNREIERLKKEFSKIGQPGYDINNDPRASKFEQAKNRLNDRLSEKLGPYSPPYELQTRKAANSQWLMGIGLPPTAIRFERLSRAQDILPDQKTEEPGNE